MSDNLVAELLKASELDKSEGGFAYILLRQASEHIAALKSQLQAAQEEIVLLERVNAIRNITFEEQLAARDEELRVLKLKLAARDQHCSEYIQIKNQLEADLAEAQRQLDDRPTIELHREESCQVCDLLSDLEESKRMWDGALAVQSLLEQENARLVKALSFCEDSMHNAIRWIGGWRTDRDIKMLNCLDRALAEIGKVKL